MQPAGVMDGRSTVKEGGLARLLERFSIVSSLLEFDERSLKGRERERERETRGSGLWIGSLMKTRL